MHVGRCCTSVPAVMLCHICRLPIPSELGDSPADSVGDAESVTTMQHDDLIHPVKLRARTVSHILRSTAKLLDKSKSITTPWLVRSSALPFPPDAVAACKQLCEAQHDSSCQLLR
jgi:hypothetical protein